MVSKKKGGTVMRIRAGDVNGNDIMEKKESKTCEAICH